MATATDTKVCAVWWSVVVRCRHLDGTVLESFSRPTVLITDAYNALVELPARRQRDAQLLESIMATLKGGGNVLLPADTAGRVLELLLMLHSYWEYNSFGKTAYPLVFLANESYYTVDFARSMIEWMSKSRMFDILISFIHPLSLTVAFPLNAVMKQFDDKRDNPFSLKYDQSTRRVATCSNPCDSHGDALLV